MGTKHKMGTATLKNNICFKMPVKGLKHLSNGRKFCAKSNKGSTILHRVEVSFANL